MFICVVSSCGMVFLPKINPVSVCVWRSSLRETTKADMGEVLNYIINNNNNNSASMDLHISQHKSTAKSKPTSENHTFEIFCL